MKLSQEAVDRATKKAEEILGELRKQKQQILDRLMIELLLTFIIIHDLEDELEQFRTEWMIWKILN